MGVPAIECPTCQWKYIHFELVYSCQCRVPVVLSMGLNLNLSVSQEQGYGQENIRAKHVNLN